MREGQGFPTKKSSRHGSHDHEPQKHHRQAFARKHRRESVVGEFVVIEMEVLQPRQPAEGPRADVGQAGCD